MTARSAKLVTRLLMGATIFAGLALAPAAFAADDETFMHIDGIPGEVISGPHVNDILVRAYTQSFGTKNCSRVNISKTLDRSSPTLISRAAGNVLIPSVIITIGRNNIDFFKATLETVLIERVDLGDPNTFVEEVLTLKPRNIRIEYRAQRADGSLAPPVVSVIDCT